MLDIGWTELMVIGVVALIAIGPKELPGVLRMVGQWLGKARRMAGEFQSQFQEAMREAEVAEMKKQFDEVTQTASNVASGNVLTSTVKDVEDALKLDTSAIATPTEPEPPVAEPPAAEALAVEAPKETTVHEAATEPPPQPATLQPVDKAS